MAVSHRGAISFGMVHIPVGLYTATQDNDIHFNQLCKEDGSRVRYKKVCDRCGKEFKKAKNVSFACMLAEELQNEDNDEIVLLEDGVVDVGELARTAFILDMDTKTLCSEDCKGLCPRCGADLNLGPCSCKKETDPRLAVLAKLLEK